jgi:hypothetical protein
MASERIHGMSPTGFRSDGAFMDVAPARACVAWQWASDGVVGLFVVGSGVLVWRVVRACYPAAGQAQPQFDPAFPVLPALWTSCGEGLDVGGGGNMSAAARDAGVVRAVDRLWHHGPRLVVRRHVCPCLANSRRGRERNGQCAQRSSPEMMSGPSFRLRDWTGPMRTSKLIGAE